MGLAASQGRLLMLTMRQSDVEGKLQFVANQRLSLSRQTSNLSSEHNRALNARKLEWSVDGSTSNLTYDLFMNPTASSIANQYLVADSNGRVILDDSYSNIFGNASSGSNAGSVTCPQFLANRMHISESAAQTFIISSASNPDAPTGVDINQSYFSLAEGIDGLQSLLIKDFSNVSDSYDNYAYDMYTAISEIDSNINLQIQNVSGLSADELGRMNMSTNTYMSDEGVPSKLTYNASTGDTDNNPLTYGRNSELDALLRLKRNIGSIKTLLDSYSSTPNGKYGADDLKKMLGTAISMLLMGGKSTDYLSSIPNLANCAGQLLSTGGDRWGYDREGKDGPLPNDILLDYSFGKFSGLNYDSKGQWSTTQGGATAYNRDSGNFTENLETLSNTLKQARIRNNKPVQSTSTNGNTGVPTAPTEQNIADFYINIYNQISSKGWVRNSAIGGSDGKYLQNLILNGSAFLYKCNNGAWSLSSASDSESPIRNVADEEAVAREESNYEAEKDRLDYKEKMLDVEQNNLDTERASITTEMESVQKIIDNNIKKFKMFEA